MKKLLLLAASLLTAFLAFGAPEIVLNKEDVFVTAEKIYLKDIADIYNAEEKDKSLLGAIYIKNSAVPGRKVLVKKETVVNLVRKYYGDIMVAGPDSVNVITRGGRVEPADINETAKKYVMDNMPWMPQDAEIEIRQRARNINVADGEITLKVRDDGRMDFKGNVLVPVEVYADGEFKRLEPVSLFIKVTADVYVAGRQIKRREMFTADGVTAVRKDITNLPSDVVTDLSIVTGKETKRSIMPGTVLLRSMFDEVPMFRRGAAVKVTVKIRGLSLETSGIAQDDGKQGMNVKVKLDSGKIIEGKVTQDGTVIIQK